MGKDAKEEVSYRGITVRDNKYPESYDEYIEAIYRISLAKLGGWVKNKEISKRLKVKAPSVSNMLDKLSKADMINWTPRKGIRLSEKGKKRAKEIVSYHIVMELFLKNVLKMKDNIEINRLACDFEHHFTPDLKTRFLDLLGIKDEIENIDNTINENRFPKHISTQQLYNSEQVIKEIRDLQTAIVQIFNHSTNLNQIKKAILTQIQKKIKKF